jgi:hypothetical protein
VPTGHWTPSPKRRGGLVHDQHPRVGAERLGDLDDLLIGDRQPAGGARRVDAHAEPGEQLLGLRADRGAVDHAQAAPGVAAHHDVLRDRQVGNSVGSW